MAQEFTDANFKSELETDKLLVADFWAAWCRPCHALAPLIDKISKDYPDVKVGKVNIDENPDITEQYKISAVPAILFFKNGEVVERLVGLQHEAKLVEVITRNS